MCCTDHIAADELGSLSNHPGIPGLHRSHQMHISIKKHMSSVIVIQKPLGVFDSSKLKVKINRKC